MVELRKNLKMAIETLKQSDHALVTSISSGCELFLRFITLTALDHSVSISVIRRVTILRGDHIRGSLLCRLHACEFQIFQESRKGGLCKGRGRCLNSPSLAEFLLSWQQGSQLKQLLPSTDQWLMVSIYITSYEQLQDFKATKSLLVERGNLFLKKVDSSRKKIARIAHPFIRDGAVSISIRACQVLPRLIEQSVIYVDSSYFAWGISTIEFVL